LLYFCADPVLCPPVSGSNLASHIVGSLKKGKSLTPIPPTAHYATLPSHVHARTLSEGVVASTAGLAVPILQAGGGGGMSSVAHKRSPSTDSGNAGSRSTTPVSYRFGKGACVCRPYILYTATKIPFMYSFSGNCARPQSQFPNSFVCERYFLYQNRQTDPGIIYISHRYMSVELGDRTL
jgi:hypothetical protein